MKDKAKNDEIIGLKAQVYDILVQQEELQAEFRVAQEKLQAPYKELEEKKLALNKEIEKLKEEGGEGNEKRILESGNTGS